MTAKATLVSSPMWLIVLLPTCRSTMYFNEVFSLLQAGCLSTIEDANNDIFCLFITCFIVLHIFILRSFCMLYIYAI